MYFLHQLVIYVHYFCFNRKLYVFTGIIRGFEEYSYLRIQEGQLRIYLRSFKFRKVFNYPTWTVQVYFPCVNPILFVPGEIQTTFGLKVERILLTTVSIFFTGTNALNSHSNVHIKSATIILRSCEGLLFERGCLYQSEIVSLPAVVDALIYQTACILLA